MRVVTIAALSASDRPANAGSSLTRWRTSVAMPATCGVAMDVPDMERYVLPRTAETMLPPGAAISGLSLRSGVTPHEVKSETDGLVEASLRPACGLEMVMEPDSLALMASMSASFSFFVMVTVGIVWVASMVAT